MDKGKKRAFCFLTILALLIFGGLGHAAIPLTINFQGLLTDSTGAPVNGEVPMTFAVYNGVDSVEALWTEEQVVSVVDGIYSVELGSVNPLGLPFDEPYYLGITVGTDQEMRPRQPLTSVSYAMRARFAESIADNVVGEANIEDGSITLSKLGNVCSPGEVLVQTSAGWVCGPGGAAGCAAGDYINCYTGDRATLGVGICKGGVRFCLDSGGGAFGSCEGQVLPQQENCNAVDDDCNGVVDDNAVDAPIWYADSDGDNFGDPGGATPACEQPAGFVTNADDCNDGQPTVYLGAAEICDGLDNDCNDLVDDDCRTSFPACTEAEQQILEDCALQCGDNVTCANQCVQSGGLTAECADAAFTLAFCAFNAGCQIGDVLCAEQSCPDEYAAVYVGILPECTFGETRPCGTDVGACEFGTQTCILGGVWGPCEGGVEPAEEVCGDNIDNDCSGAADDAFQYCPDGDGDGSPSDVGCVQACDQPEGFVLVDGEQEFYDCDDGNPAIGPFALDDTCNGVDENCDGIPDDGYQSETITCGTGICQGQGFTWCENGQVLAQCVTLSPQEEVCDGLDNDCDGLIDEGVDLSSDPENCGACGNVCGQLPHVSSTGCISGVCSVIVCESGWADVDGLPENGCEFDLDTDPVCSSTITSIGSVSGDTGSDSLVFSGIGEQWLVVSVNELLDFPDQDPTDFLSATITLTPPAGSGHSLETDYDLFVYCDSCAGSEAGKSENFGSTQEQVHVRWEEVPFVGVDSGRDIVIWVKFWTGTSADNWQLTVQGNTKATSVNTCTAK